MNGGGGCNAPTPPNRPGSRAETTTVPFSFSVRSDLFPALVGFLVGPDADVVTSDAVIGAAAPTVNVGQMKVLKGRSRELKRPVILM